MTYFMQGGNQKALRVKRSRSFERDEDERSSKKFQEVPEIIHQNYQNYQNH